MRPFARAQNFIKNKHYKFNLIGKKNLNIFKDSINQVATKILCNI